MLWINYCRSAISWYSNGSCYVYNNSYTSSNLATAMTNSGTLQVTHSSQALFKEHTEPPNLNFSAYLYDTLRALLLKYHQAFAIPNGLPPSRSCHHKISLQNGSQLVKVWPYRYQHNQKNEIELMVSQMFQQGLIEHRNIPFASPVILVKRKDGSWRFCTDYRALNAITIKDAFPMNYSMNYSMNYMGLKYFLNLIWGPAIIKFCSIHMMNTNQLSEHTMGIFNGLSCLLGCPMP